MKTLAQLQTITANYWDTYCEIFPKLIKFDCPEIRLSKRLTSTAGRNHFEENYIILGSKFLAQFEHNMLNIILPHEIAHQIDYNLNGWHYRKTYHGAQWCAIMGRVGQNPLPYHSMELK